jgi:hypothetical protein
LPVSCWKITFPLYNDIAEFHNCPRASQKIVCFFRQGFRLDIQPENLHQPWHLPRLCQNHSLTIDIDGLRGLAIFAQEIAVLLMAHCSAHVSDDVIRSLTEARVRIIIFAPHTTQVFQVLDFTLLGVLKRCPRYEVPFDDDNATVKVITKEYHDFRQTMARHNVWGTFRALAFEFDMRMATYGFLFDEVKLRESAGFDELCFVDFSLDQLSGRRRIAVCVSLIMDRDIFRCQNMQKVASGIVMRMDSYDLHVRRFFDENELEFLFYS